MKHLSPRALLKESEPLPLRVTSRVARACRALPGTGHPRSAINLTPFTLSSVTKLS
ncbi:MAG: hypothetical protein HZA93_18600 [Verrucomicrobia bacterium]|nr:hypothetical protein [Verrucomicrobiota bacterium]